MTWVAGFSGSWDFAGFFPVEKIGNGLTLKRSHREIMILMKFRTNVKHIGANKE